MTDAETVVTLWLILLAGVAIGIALSVLSLIVLAWRSDRGLHCWYDFGGATCMEIRDHRGDHVPTDDDDITVSFGG